MPALVAWPRDVAADVESIRAFHGDGHRVSPNRFAVRAAFVEITREGHCYVLAGSCAYNGTIARSGEVLHVEAGEYDVVVEGGTSIVRVWRLPAH